MATTDWLFPGSAVEVARSGTTFSWSNVSNILADDTSYATWGSYILSSSIKSPYLVAKGFAFADHIPEGAEILGVEARISRWEAGSEDNIYEDVVKLYNSGVIGGSKNEGSEWGTSQVTVEYGGASDVWSASLTASIIRGANFGLALGVTGAGWFSPQAIVDFMQMRVTWRPIAILEIF